MKRVWRLGGTSLRSLGWGIGAAGRFVAVPGGRQVPEGQPVADGDPGLSRAVRVALFFFWCIHRSLECAGGAPDCAAAVDILVTLR